MINPLLLLLLLIIATANATNFALKSGSCLLEVKLTPNSTNFALELCYRFTHYKIQQTFNWKQCTNLCCDPSKNYNEDTNSFGSCEQDKKNYDQNKANMYFALSALSCVILVILVLAIIKIYEKLKIWLQKRLLQNLNRPIQLRPHNQNTQANFRLQNNNIQSPQWIQQIGPVPQNCSICANQAPNMRLADCNHIFHGHCWISWFRDNKFCAECRNTSVQRIKIYCSHCFSNYFMSNSADLQNTQVLPEFVCRTCAQTH